MGHKMRLGFGEAPDEERQPQWVNCGGCGAEWIVCTVPMPVGEFAAVLEAATCPSGCDERRICMGQKAKPTPKGDPVAWLYSGDTGISSMTIWHVMTGRAQTDPHWWPGHPHDPDDFGRCHRLLELMPEWRARLGEVAKKHPSWRGLVGHWDELTALYLEELPSGTAPKLYARMQELIGRRKGAA